MPSKKKPLVIVTRKLPDSVDDNRGALIEPFTCGYYAVLRSGGTNASETVVVSGGGTIGLVSAAAATIYPNPLRFATTARRAWRECRPPS